MHLNAEQAKKYEKSKWLRPAKEALDTPAPPLMSHMPKLVPVSKPAQPYVPQPSAEISTNSYNANMAAIRQREAAEDGLPAPVSGKDELKAKLAAQNQAAASATIDEPTGGETAQGTGNKEVI